MTSTPDPAVVAARRVVGLYGDPDVSWSIVLALEFAVPLARDAVAAAAADLAVAHPHLGRASELTSFAEGPGEQEVLDVFADQPYGERDPLVRIALRDDGRLLIVAAHHGAVDGLGLLGAAALLTGREITSSARGIDRSAEPTGFVKASLGRLVEAGLTPPLRLKAHPSAEVGDWLRSQVVPARRPSSGALVAAAAGAVHRWNGSTAGRTRGRRLVIAMGLSRRPGRPTPTPDRDTAYVRLFAGTVVTASDGVDVMTATPPEPAFPVTDGGGLAPRVARLLASRLGSTLLISNLGLIEGEQLIAARLWPVPAGPAGTAVGLASASGTTSITVRQRRNAFTAADAARFTDVLASELQQTAQ